MSRYDQIGRDWPYSDDSDLVHRYRAAQAWQLWADDRARVILETDHRWWWRCLLTASCTLTILATILAWDWVRATLLEWLP